MKTIPSLFRLPGGALSIAAGLFLFFLFGPPYVLLAADSTISELMEQGVYSEETKGDLDAAMQLYRQVITKADAGQAVAAQAQYRLAACLDKKKDHAAATAAYEKLVREYPDQKDLVALANEYLAAGTTLLPAPWTDGEEMRFNINLPSGFKMGVARYDVVSATVGGQKIWQFSSHLGAGGVQQWSRVEADAASLKPIHCRWKHSQVGDSDTTYAPGHAAVKLKGKDGVKSIDITGAVYDNEEALQLMRCLPLAAGYEAKLSIFSGLTGGNVVPIQLTVASRENVQVPAGKFDCYKVELSIKQTFWYSSDVHHYLVKFEAGGVVAELAAVKQHSPGESEHFEDPVRGFSFMVPAGWMVDRKEGPENSQRSEITLFDAEAISYTKMRVENLENLSKTDSATVRAFAEHQVGEWRKYVKDLSVRADSWKEVTVAGHPGVSVVADFVQGKDPMVGRGIYAFVDGMAVDISSASAPEDFEAFQPKIDAVVASYKGK